MLLACLPARYARYMSDISCVNEVALDGQAKYVPHGIRIIETLLLDRFDPDDVRVCYADQLPLFVGKDTRAVGIHAHKGMEILNRNNWFPFCTWIIGLPGETDADTKESLDLLFALRDAKWAVTPTLFVPLEETRLEKRGHQSAKLVELTDLQWEFFFTCWRYNLDFFRNTPKVQWSFNLGVPIYYYTLGRRLFGDQMKYPLFRLGHMPEWLLRGKLYLDLSKGKPKYRVPDRVEVPSHDMRPIMPEAY